MKTVSDLKHRLVKRAIQTLPGIEWASTDWVQATFVTQPDDPIARDGKTVRAAGTQETKAPHLLSS